MRNNVKSLLQSWRARGQSPAIEELPQFDGFPYLVTRLVPALYHLTLLPGDATRDTLVSLAERQLHANRLDACLALDAGHAIFFWSDGRVQPSDSVPRGGTVLAGKLAPAVEFLDTRELRARRRRLDEFIKRRGTPGSFMFGDFTKGGRAATPEELHKLAGTDAAGVPRGLTECGSCKDWRGVCLDPGEKFAGMLMTVHCRCDNHNRCGGCGGALYGRRLQANYYDPVDNAIWHVPGFCCLKHQCVRAVSPT